jgi:hypothetical protein
LTAGLLALGNYQVWFVLASLALLNAITYVALQPSLGIRAGSVGAAR